MLKKLFRIVRVVYLDTTLCMGFEFCMVSVMVLANSSLMRMGMDGYCQSSVHFYECQAMTVTIFGSWGYGTGGVNGYYLTTLVWWSLQVVMWASGPFYMGVR